MAGRSRPIWPRFSAARDGRAWLTLETGAIYEVELHHLTTTTAEFRVLPPFDSLLD